MRAALPAVIAFLLAGLLSAVAARTAVAVVEDVSGDAVEEALEQSGQDWASVVSDGLQIILEGTAPNEAQRFRAISTAGQIVDASRVIDNMAVAPSMDIAPPEFAVEILRNDSGISLIGLIPADFDGDRMRADIDRIAGDGPVADFLEEADYPVPQAWPLAVDYALDALEQLPRSKISITAGRVAVTAITDSEAEKRQLETELSRTVPDGVRLALTLTAPRPAITPFTVRFVLDGRGARFEACSADTPEAQRRIIAAATEAGLTGRVTCTIGLGVPSGTWGEAVADAIGAVASLGGGTVTFSDADIVLTAALGTEQAAFDEAVGDLAGRLPDLYALEAVLPQAAERAEQGPPEFTATLSPEGLVQIRGRVPDQLIGDTLENFAKARFGADQVRLGTRVAEDLPQDWAVRILAAVDALARLENGAVRVTPDDVSVRGDTGDQEASATIARLMIDKLGQGADFEVDVTYREELDPSTGLPTPQECLMQVSAVTEGRKITFDPGSATLTRDTENVVDDIADILRRCPDARMEIAGYTDSQGRDQMNLDLSQERADAVLAAIRARRVPVAAFTAVGFGEADPIADNGTEAGREANRRIEFRLLSMQPAGDAADAAEDGAPDAEGDAAADDAAEGAEDPAEGAVPPAAQTGLEESGE